MQITARNKVASQFTDPLFSPSNARDKIKNRGGFIDRQCKGVGVGKRKISKRTKRKIQRLCTGYKFTALVALDNINSPNKILATENPSSEPLCRVL